jgi:hypothetical protein
MNTAPFGFRRARDGRLQDAPRELAQMALAAGLRREKWTADEIGWLLGPTRRVSEITDSDIISEVA